MPDGELLKTLSSLAVRADAIDLDCIGSRRYFNDTIELLKNEALDRMERSEISTNINLLTDLMDAAVQTTEDDDHPLEPYEECLAKILSKMALVKEDLMVFVGS
ncbi:MAG: hypothetical protein NTV36_01385 [Candidatus Staskawiczbacteria bacterium]|nr:hypothetical protein [Candidatus Staskawiczbacteria bacterium]